MATAAPNLSDNLKPGALFHSRKSILALSLVLLTLVVYNPATGNGFVGFDDPAYVTANPHVRSGLTWTMLKWAFSSTEHDNWHPVTWLSHALDYQLFHLNPAGHHFANVLVHILTAVLLFIALEALTGSIWPSWAVAALFALHPVNVQSVAWISERKNTLSTLFLVLTLLAYCWYARSPKVERYLLVALFFVFGLMAKPMITTLPFVLLLLDYWPLDRLHTSFRSARGLMVEKLPLVALSGASAAITIAAQKAGGAIRSDHPFWLRVANVVTSYVCYLDKAAWPSRLAVFYPYPTQAAPAWQLGGAALLLLLITAVVLLARNKPCLAVGWFWYLGTLIPVIGLVQVGEQGMADRYAYVPFIGLFIAIAWTVWDEVRARRLSPLYPGLLLACVLLAYAISDRAQIGYWKNNLTLWSHALAVTENNYVAEDSLGAELTDEGRLDEAMKHFQAASAINPRDAFSVLDLGVCEKRLGDFPSAIQHYQTALELSREPTLRATAFSNLGSIYRAEKDYARALDSYQSALKLEPDNLFALVGMGILAQKSGDFDHALQYYSRAISADPSDSDYLLLSQALAKAGHREQAAAAYHEAQARSRNWAVTASAVNRLLAE